MEIKDPQVKFEKIPRDEIQVDPFFIPKKLELKSIGPSKDTEQNYKSLFSQAKFQMPIVVGKLKGVTFLIDSYELFRVFCDIHYQNPKAPIPCISVDYGENGDAKTLKHLAVRLSKIRGDKDSSHLHRLLNLHLLNIDKLSPRESRSLVGIGNDSAGRKMFERDRRLLNSPKILALVLGVSEADLEKRTLESIVLPRPHKAKLTYNQGVRLLEILPDDTKKQTTFLEAMEERYERIENSKTSPDEKTLPIFERRNFSFGDLLAIAKSISTDGKYSALNSADEADQRWNVLYSDLTGELHLDELNVNLHTHKDPDPPPLT